MKNNKIVVLDTCGIISYICTPSRILLKFLLTFDTKDNNFSSNVFDYPKILH